MNECDKVRQRYDNRLINDRAALYSPLLPDVCLSRQEKERAIIKLFSRDLCWKDLANLKLIEVGCGNGDNFFDFLRFGFKSQNLCGIELLPERAAIARHNLPSALNIYVGDASKADITPSSQDVVFQAVVFSSLLDDAFQHELAGKMWQWVKPGGGVLWYDFIYNNPFNPDVRGVPIKRVRKLFPAGNMIIRRVTLAPPVSRIICRLHPSLYAIFNIFPFLRTHILCWIQKN